MGRVQLQFGERLSIPMASIQVHHWTNRQQGDTTLRIVNHNPIVRRGQLEAVGATDVQLHREVEPIQTTRAILHRLLEESAESKDAVVQRDVSFGNTPGCYTPLCMEWIVVDNAERAVQLLKNLELRATPVDDCCWALAIVEKAAHGE